MERVGEGARSHAVRLVRFLVRNFVVAHGRHRIINTLLCSGMYNNVQHTVQPPLAVPLSTQLCCLYRENEPIKSSVLHLTSCRCKTLTRSPKAAHTHIQHTYWQIRSTSSQLWHIGNPSHLRLPSDSLAMRPFDVLLAVMFDAYPACTVCRSAIVDDTTTGTKKKNRRHCQHRPESHGVTNQVQNLSVTDWCFLMNDNDSNKLMISVVLTADFCSKITMRIYCYDFLFPLNGTENRVCCHMHFSHFFSSAAWTHAERCTGDS